MNNRAVEETVETFMVVLHSSDPHVMLNPGATVSINDSSSKSVLVCVHIGQYGSVLYLGKGINFTMVMYGISTTVFSRILSLCMGEDSEYDGGVEFSVQDKRMQSVEPFHICDLHDYHQTL